MNSSPSAERSAPRNRRISFCVALVAIAAIVPSIVVSGLNWPSDSARANAGATDHLGPYNDAHGVLGPFADGESPDTRGMQVAEESGIDDEAVWSWGDEAGERADRIRRAIDASADRSTFSTMMIDNKRKAIIVYFVGEPSQEVKSEIRSVAGPIPVRISARSRATNAGVVELVERMYSEVDPERKKVGLISTNVSNTEVQVTVWSAPDQTETGDAVVKYLAPLAVKIEYSNRPASDPKLAGSRWADKSSFKGGAAIVSTNGQFCTSGYSARRKSDGAKVMISAAHCGQHYPWKTFEGGSISFGSSWVYSLATDSMYLKAPNGAGYGSLIYSGSVAATATRVRKNSAYDPIVGNAVYSSGAASGGSALTVVAVNQWGWGGEGPGFQTDSQSGDKNVGHGDSGGPVYRLHSDGKYTPLGMIDSIGWSVNSNPKKVAASGICSKGIQIWPDQTQRECSKRSFHINATAIENALGVDIYKP